MLTYHSPLNFSSSASLVDWFKACRQEKIFDRENIENKSIVSKNSKSGVFGKNWKFF